ncbi:hypothetical protein HY504_00560 [Candidatus Wolfebacteria bacterium]|nr:hypothetical protein [Candidatus Wolfebacteria bacterium]
MKIVPLLIVLALAGTAWAQAPAPSSIEDEVKELSETVIALSKRVGVLEVFHKAADRRFAAQSQSIGSLGAKVADAQRDVVAARSDLARAVQVYAGTGTAAAPVDPPALPPRPSTSAPDRDAQVAELLKQAAGLLTQGAAMLTK